jgi:hypothetical protein
MGNMPFHGVVLQAICNPEVTADAQHLNVVILPHCNQYEKEKQPSANRLFTECSSC